MPRDALTSSRSTNLRAVMRLLPRDTPSARAMALAALADGGLDWPATIDKALSLPGLTGNALAAIASLAHRAVQAGFTVDDARAAVARVAFVVRQDHGVSL